jgi:hypothetical protein
MEGQEAPILDHLGNFMNDYRYKKPGERNNNLANSDVSLGLPDDGSRDSNIVFRLARRVQDEYVAEAIPLRFTSYEAAKVWVITNFPIFDYPQYVWTVFVDTPDW